MAIMVDIAQAREDPPGLMDRVRDGGIVTIASGNCSAVLLSEDGYGSMMETLLLSDPTMARDLDRTRGTPVSEMEVWRCPDPERGSTPPAARLCSTSPLPFLAKVIRLPMRRSRIRIARSD